MPPKADALRTVRVAVCSRSFSKNPTLRAELLARYRHVTFNDAGAQLQETHWSLSSRVTKKR